jgi:signal transduction histidine kinase
MKKNMELYSLDKAKNKFMEVISHELNTPLMVLQNLISRLAKNEVTTVEERDQTILKADESLKRILDKINDIYSLTKYNMMTGVNKEMTDVREILEIIVNEATIVSRERNMIYRLETEEDLPMVEVNWESFYLMIYHIVLNAIRYTKDFGTIVIGARKSSFQDEEIDNKETLVVYVQDNGMGIPESELGEVFIPFHELVDSYAHHSGTVEYNSSGLGVGLSIAKRIAELHNGDIKITSKEREGTTVFIFIPFSELEGFSISEPKQTDYNNKGQDDDK